MGNENVPAGRSLTSRALSGGANSACSNSNRRMMCMGYVTSSASTRINPDDDGDSNGGVMMM